MYDGMFTARGTVAAIKKSTFETKTSNVLQLLKRGGKNNAIEVLNIKLHEGADLNLYAEGTTVELEIEIINFEGQLYYRALRDLAVKADSRGVDPRVAAAKL